MDILSDEPFFKFPAEFQIFFIDRGELIFTDDGGKRSRVTDFRVAGEELVCDILMVLTGETFTDAILVAKISFLPMICSRLVSIRIRSVLPSYLLIFSIGVPLSLNLPIGMSVTFS